MNPEELLELARKASERAIAPFSGLKVGAALLGASGRVYLGSNIESKVLGLTVCAERVALWKALSEGEREFKALALTAFKGGKEVSGITPCGACRQLLLEFAHHKPTSLEKVEGLEQLRALEMGMRVKVVLVEGRFWPVDTPEDIPRVEEILRERWGT